MPTTARASAEDAAADAQPIPRVETVWSAHEFVFAPFARRITQFVESRDGPIPWDAVAVAERARDDLFKTLQNALVFAVNADLAFFEPAGILYSDIWRLASKKDRDAAKSVLAMLGDGRKLRKARKRPRKLDNEEAYGVYCRLLLDRPEPQSPMAKLRLEMRPLPPDGLEAFFARQQLMHRLLHRMTTNFIDALEECLDRAAADRDAIEQVFLDGGRIHSLAGVEAAGGEPHKRGRRVFFLRFRYDDGAGARRKRTIVYKPGDLELDYRMTGRNSPELVAFLKAKAADPGYVAPPFQSLHELANETVLTTANGVAADEAAARARDRALAAGRTPAEADAAAKAKADRVRSLLPLPTYVILPRNPVSRAKTTATTTADRVPLTAAYGYMTYLTHRPKVPAPPRLERRVRSLAHRRGGQADPGWDWVTDRNDVAEACFRIWGRLSVLACLFLQSDLHWENRLIHGQKPHVIDLENALVKPVNTLDQTLLFFGDSKLQFNADTAMAMPVRASHPAAGRPLQTLVGGNRPEYVRGQLYIYYRDDRSHVAPALRVAGGQTVAPPGLANLTDEVLRGAQECFYAARDHKQRLQDWAKKARLEDCLVRHVVLSTETFSLDRTSFFMKLADAQLELKPREPKLDDVEAKFLARFMAGLQSIRSKAWHNPDSGAPYRQDEDNPVYYLDTPEYNGRDLLNGDIPSWYKQAKSRDIVASDGRVANNFQLASEPIRAHYYTAALPGLLERSLDEKLPQHRTAAEQVFDGLTACFRDPPVGKR